MIWKKLYLRAIKHSYLVKQHHHAAVWRHYTAQPFNEGFYFENLNHVREVGGENQLESAEIINKTVFPLLGKLSICQLVFLLSFPAAVKTPHWRCRSLTVRSGLDRRPPLTSSRSHIDGWGRCAERAFSHRKQIADRLTKAAGLKHTDSVSNNTKVRQYVSDIKPGDTMYRVCELTDPHRGVDRKGQFPHTQQI